MKCSNDGTFRYWTLVTLGDPEHRERVMMGSENETFADNFNPINK